MTDLEDALRRVLADPARELAAWPDAVERVRSGMRRRYARRLLSRISIALGAVLATLAAALAPAMLAQDQPPPSSGPVVIPFVDQPPLDPPVPSLQPRPALRPCHPEDLEGWSVETDGAMGRLINEVRADLREDAAACTLSGHPGLSGLRKGRRAAIPATPTDPPAPYIVAGSTPATLEPGETVAVVIQTYGGCLDGRTETVYTSVRLAFGGGDVRLPGMDLNATCGVGVGTWYRVGPELVDRSASLQSSITAPAAAKLGTDLDFVVTVTNPTPEPIALDPCPAYIASVDIAIKNVSVHRLNCFDSAGQARVIPAGGSLSFAIRLALPAADDAQAGASVGPTTLDWILGSSPTAQVPVTIVAP